MEKCRSELDELAGLAQVAAAQMLARTVAGALESIASTGRPLTELQKAGLVEAALLGFDGYRAEVLEQLRTDAAIRAWAEQRRAGVDADLEGDELEDATRGVKIPTVRFVGQDYFGGPQR